MIICLSHAILSVMLAIPAYVAPAIVRRCMFVETFERLDQIQLQANTPNRPQIWIVSRSMSSVTVSSSGWNDFLHRFNIWQPNLGLVYQVRRGWPHPDQAQGPGVP